MMCSTRRIINLSAFALLTIGSGCDGGGKPSVDSSMEEATVKGVVKFKGELVTKGEIAFDPSNYQRKMEAARRVKIGPDGSYTLKTLVGDNRVSFAIPAMARDPQLQDLMIPYIVKRGENSFNIELPPSSSKP